MANLRKEAMSTTKYVMLLTSMQAIPVDEDTDDDVQAMMAEEEKSMLKNYQEGSFQRLFWEEQKKAAANCKKDLQGIH